MDQNKNEILEIIKRREYDFSEFVFIIDNENKLIGEIKL